MKKGKVSSAPLWKRTFAYIIDSLIISIFLATINAILFISLMGSGSFWASLQQPPVGLLAKIAIINPLVTVFYWVILENGWQKTLGKLLMGIEVRSLTGKLTFKQAFFRNISKIHVILLFIDALYLFRSKTQRFSDKIAETEVVESDKK